MWHSSGNILKKRINQHGLTDIVEAGLLCRQAELLIPNLFRAVSVRNQILHLELKKAQLLDFKMREGPFLEQLNNYAQSRHLPEISRIRLTFLPE